jgi:hypothetical protein
VTGDDASRYALAKAADKLWGAWANAMGAPTLNLTAAGMTKADPRIHARVLMAQLARVARRRAPERHAGGVGHGRQLPRADRCDSDRPRRVADRDGRAARRVADGVRVRRREQLRGGPAAHAARRRAYVVHARERGAEGGAAADGRARDRLPVAQFVPGQGFPYGDLALTGKTSCPDDNGAQISPDLTGLMVASFGWLARQATTLATPAEWAARGDAVFAQMVAGWQLGDGGRGNGAKQFNQAFVESWPYLGWRAGLTVG